MLNSIPHNHSRQVTSQYYLTTVLTHEPQLTDILDFGCGEGNSFDLIKKQYAQIRWVGLDLEHSPEVNKRATQSRNFCTYDGVHIPFQNSSFDVVYTNQVFEHVRHPEMVLKEIKRILRNGGYFMGSTSYLEPYHSLSLWNYTPYGFQKLLEENGFCLKELRPSIDALSLIVRSLLQTPRFFNYFWQCESPLNFIVSGLGRLWMKNSYEINKVKLQYCGQFCFLARKI